jgi:4a-hydroxytetrahydrobiopterin dehydratase
MSDLPNKCEPCTGDVPALSQILCEVHVEALDGWQLEFPRIRKFYEMKDFRAALAWINRVGMLAEEEAHHPNLHIRNWNEVEIELYTHKIDGLSINDFVLAKKIDGLAK